MLAGPAQQLGIAPALVLRTEQAAITAPVGRAISA